MYGAFEHPGKVVYADLWTARRDPQLRQSRFRPSGHLKDAPEAQMRVGRVGAAPSAAELSARWHRQLRDALEICALLPAERAGHAVLTPDGALFAGDRTTLSHALTDGAVLFHPGRLRGAFPIVKSR